MNRIGLLLDIGNIIFFVSSLPQLITAYRNRRDLKGLSRMMLAGYAFATAIFAVVGIISSGYFTLVLNAINAGFFSAQAYWKSKYAK